MFKVKLIDLFLPSKDLKVIKVLKLEINLEGLPQRFKDYGRLAPQKRVDSAKH